jgi:HEAT repeat protein
MDANLQSKLANWLTALRVPGIKGRDHNAIIAEMRDQGGEHLFPLLLAYLGDPDPLVRSAICETLLRIDAHRAMEFVLPILFDADDYVRWHLCGCLSRFGDQTAVGPLIKVLKTDKDAKVRGTAAYALGGICSPAAIPALVSAMESDHEYDCLGHSASSCAATALDEILGTEETRIKVSATLRKMRQGKPDLHRLKHLAEERYQAWSRGGA